MNWDRIQGNGKQLTGKTKTPSDKLTHEAQVTVIGKRERPAGKRRRRWSYGKEQAGKELD